MAALARFDKTPIRPVAPLWVLRAVAMLTWAIVIATLACARSGDAVLQRAPLGFALLYGTGMAVVPWFIGPSGNRVAPVCDPGSNDDRGFAGASGQESGALGPLCVLWTALILAYLPFWTHELAVVARGSLPDESLRAGTGVLALFAFFLGASLLSLVSFTLRRGWLFFLVHAGAMGVVVFYAMEITL